MQARRRHDCEAAGKTLVRERGVGDRAFVALGGVGYAATKIGASDIKPDAIRSKHIKDSTITPDDIADALSGSDNVNADALNGLGAVDFVQGGGRLERVDQGFIDPDGAGGGKGNGPAIDVPGGFIRAFCLQQSSGIEVALNADPNPPGAVMRAWRDDGAAAPTVTNLDTTNVNPSDDSDFSPVQAADRVIWSGTSTAGQFTAILLTSYDGGNACSVTGFAVKSG